MIENMYIAVPLAITIGLIMGWIIGQGINVASAMLKSWKGF